MQYGIPLCMKGCAYFKRGPEYIGGKAACDKYKEIPDKIFFRAGHCEYYTDTVENFTNTTTIADDNRLVYVVNDKAAGEFATLFKSVDDFSFELMGKTYTCQKGINVSINNQGGCLSDDNFFGRNLGYTMCVDGKMYPIVYHLYQNTSGHYRIFLYTNGNKMLTSMNLSTGLEKNGSGRIILDIQIKISSPQSISKEERLYMRDECVKRLRNHGMRIDKNNRVYMGEYDIPKKELIHTSPKNLLIDILTVGICRNAELFDL